MENPTEEEERFALWLKQVDNEEGDLVKKYFKIKRKRGEIANEIIDIEEIDEWETKDDKPTKETVLPYRQLKTDET